MKEFKLIIIEGLDNTGKSTVIYNISEFETLFQNKIVKVIHCEKPKGDTPEEQAEYQNTFFANLAKDIIRLKKEGEVDTVILDRAWYGEYVYGQLYRNHEPLDIEMNINMVEQSLISYIGMENISFILLNVNDINFSIEHDDGLSMSEADKSKILLEQKMFVESFNISKLKNKRQIFVNDKTKFRKMRDIMRDVCEVTK